MKRKTNPFLGDLGEYQKELSGFPLKILLKPTEWICMSFNVDILNLEKHIRVTVSGKYNLNKALEGVPQVLGACRFYGVYNVLIDFRDLRGEPDLKERQEFFLSALRQQALFQRICQKKLKVAIVGPDSLILGGQAEKMSPVISFDVKAGSDPVEAIAWLEFEKPVGERNKARFKN